MNHIVGGLSSARSSQYQSGLPFSLSYCELRCFDSVRCSLPGQRKCQQLSCTRGLPGPGTSAKYLHQVTNLCSSGQLGFTCPGLDQIGNVGRNTVFGPHFFNSDMSIAKNITIHERYTAQFRMDAFNAFNHINWQPQWQLSTAAAVVNRRRSFPSEH